MVGIARKNENSAAARLSAPSSIAATMLAPSVRRRNHRQALRTADPQIVMSEIWWRRARGIVIELIDPEQDGSATISEKQTTHGLNSISLMYLPPSARRSPPAENANNTPMTKRRSPGWRTCQAQSATICRNRSRRSRESRRVELAREAVPECPRETKEALASRRWPSRKRQEFRDASTMPRIIARSESDSIFSPRSRNL